MTENPDGHTKKHRKERRRNTGKPTTKSYYVRHPDLLLSRDGEGEFLMHWLWTDFRMWAGQFKALLQMLVPHLRRQSCSKLTQLIGDTLPSVVFKIVVLLFAPRLSNNAWCRESQIKGDIKIAADTVAGGGRDVARPLWLDDAFVLSANPEKNRLKGFFCSVKMCKKYQTYRSIHCVHRP